MRFPLLFLLALLVLPGPASAEPGLSSATPLSLTEAQRLAAGDSPQLTAQQAAVTAAQQSAIGAGELPDPKLVLGIDNLPVDTSDRFSVTRDFMTMRRIGVMQDFTRSDKLKLRGERADAEVRKEAAMLALSEVNLRRDVALAWIDVYFAERQLTLLKELRGENEFAVTAAQAALAGGKGQAGDPFTAKLGVEQITDRMIDAQRAIAKARANLARWVGNAAERPLSDSPAFDEFAHPHVLSLTNLDNHPHLAMYGPMEDIADRDVRLADTAKHPDWSLEASYGQRGPNFSNMVSVAIRIDLPIFQSTRQDPAVASKVAMAAQVRAEAEAARREHEAEVKGWVADWNAGKQRLERFEASQIPLAHERSEAALASYRGGKGDLAAALDARRMEIDVRMNQLQTQLELARTWAQLNFLTLDPTTKD
jgi:outer membrane protein TolC